MGGSYRRAGCSALDADDVTSSAQLLPFFSRRLPGLAGDGEAFTGVAAVAAAAAAATTTAVVEKAGAESERTHHETPRV